jgi:hypothetical protein
MTDDDDDEPVITATVPGKKYTAVNLIVFQENLSFRKSTAKVILDSVLSPVIMNVTTGRYDADGNRTDTTLTLNNAPKSLEKAIRPLQTFFRINNIKKSTIGALEEMLKCASINGVGVHELGDHFVLGFHTAAGILNYAKDNDIILETTLKSIIESDAFDASTKCMSFLHDKISDRIFLFAFRLGCIHHYQNVDGMRGLATHLHKALNMEMSRKDRLKHRVERENLNSQVELKLCDRK